MSGPEPLPSGARPIAFVAFARILAVLMTEAHTAGNRGHAVPFRRRAELHLRSES